MAEEYTIEQGNWINEYPVNLVVENDTSAFTQDFEMEIEWQEIEDEFADDFDGIGIGYLNNEEFCRIYDDGRWFTAYEDGGFTSRQSKEDPFIAFAQLVYTIGGW